MMRIVRIGFGRIGVLDRQMHCVGLQFNQQRGWIRSLVQVDQHPDTSLSQLGGGARCDGRVHASPELIRHEPVERIARHYLQLSQRCE